MNSRYQKHSLIALTLIIAACGPGGAKSPPGDGVRSLNLESGGQWIGNAVSYGPHRDGQRPGGPGPDPEQLAEDLRLMETHWNLLRVYWASDIAEQLLIEIRDSESDMKVMLGRGSRPGTLNPIVGRSRRRSALRTNSPTSSWR